MQSIRSKIVIGLLKNRHLLKFQLKPEVVDENFSVSQFRSEIDIASAKIKLPKNISSQKFTIEGINSEWIIPSNPQGEKVLLYIHGGGFISGSCLTHRMHVAKFANECQIKSLIFDYRLAPEHPFPAAVEDCLKVYKCLLNMGFDSKNIIIGGESAGATLTLSLLLAIKENGISLPKAAFSISPITDLSCRGSSFEYNFKNDVAPKNSWKIWANMYIADNNIKNPLLSPQFGNYEGIPPLYICVGTNEIHFEDCVNVAKVAANYGVDVTLKKWDKMVHAFPLLTPLFPEARNAFMDICDFIKRQ